MKNPKNQIAVITGASSGIGSFLAREMFAQGYKLVLMARRLEKLQEIKDELEAPLQTKDRVLVLHGDVTQEESLAAARLRALETFGRIDVVVANAGIGVTGPFEKLTNDDYRKQFETNIFGVLNTVRCFLPDLKQSQGRVAIIGSVSGYVCTPGDSPYTMSKAAIRSLCDTLYPEFAKFGVTVTHIAPGFVESEIRIKDRMGAFLSNKKDPIPDWIVMPGPKAAKKIFRAIEGRWREEIITVHGKVLVGLKRHFPYITSAITKSMATRVGR